MPIREAKKAFSTVMRELFMSALRLLYIVGMILIAVDALALVHVPMPISAIVGLPLGMLAAFFLMDRYYRFQERRTRAKQARRQ